MMHLLYTTVGGSLLCVLVWLLSRYARDHLSASTIYGLWILVGARFLCFLTLPIFGRTQYTTFFMQSPYTTSFYNSLLSSYYIPEDTAIPGDAQAAEAAFSYLDFILERALPILWIVGCIALALFLILRNVQMHRRLRHAVPIMLSDENESFYAQLGEKLSVFHLPPCYHSAAVSSPCLYGVLRPRILIPLEIAGDDNRLKHILTHELCHFSSYDQVRLLARYIVLVLHWFNPIAWLYFFSAKANCEHACDQKVMRVLPTSDGTSYGATLVSLAHTRGTIWGHSMSAQGKTLKSRLQNILHPSRMRQSTFFISVLCVVLAAVLSVSGFAAMLAEPELYDLTPPPYADLEALAKLKNNKDLLDDAIALLPVPNAGYVFESASFEDDLEIFYTPLENGPYTDAYRAARQENNALLLFALYDDLDFIYYIYGDRTENHVSRYDRYCFNNPIGNLSSIAYLYRDCEDDELREEVLSVLSQNLRPTKERLYHDRIGLGSSLQQARTRWGDPTLALNSDSAISPDLDYYMYHFEGYEQTGDEYILDYSTNVIIGYEKDYDAREIRFLLTEDGSEIIRAIAPIAYTEGVDFNLEYLLTNFHVHQIECNTSGQTLCMISLYTIEPVQYLYFFFDANGDMLFCGLADNLQAMNADNLYAVYYNHCRNYLPD